MRRCVLRLLPTLMLLAIGPTVSAQDQKQPVEDPRASDAAKPSASRDFHHNFHGLPLPPELIPYQADGKFLRLEPEGMRITIPKTWKHPGGGMGLRTSFSVGGDFEVTLGFEIMEIDSPTSGFGVGVGIRAKQRGASPEEIMIARLVRPMDRHIVLWQKGPLNGRIFTTAKAGRVRLRRQGNVLYYLWSSQLDGEAFQEIHHCDIGPSEFDNVRLVAMTNQKPCNLDARLLDVRIRQGVTLPFAATTVEEDAAPQAPKTRWYLWFALGFVILNLAIGLLVAIYRRKKAQRGASA